MKNCEACGHGGAEAVPGPQVSWRYWRCARCGHAWLHPAPTTEELTQYYNTVYAVPRDLYVAHVPREHRALKSVFNRHGIRPGRMLEVGCSYGAMLDAFRRDGWEVEGIELDSRAAEIARSFYGLRVHQGRLEDVRARLSDAYDTLTLYHVLEHVEDPAAFIRGLAALCRPDGVLVIKTPNPRSFAARALAGWWEWYAAPQHVHLFSASSLRALLEAGGFATEVMESRRGDANRTLFELVRGSARRLLGRQGHGSSAVAPMSNRRWYRAIRAVIDGVGAPLDWMLAGVESPRRLVGSELLVIARKVRA